MPQNTPYTIPGFADPFSSLSHLGAAAVFAILAVPLIRRGIGVAGGVSSRVRVASLAVFAVAAVVLLTMSGVFHLLGHGGAARGVLQRLDHAAIFLLIAGTFTPIHAIMCRGVLRWGVLTCVWSIAVLGVTLKSIFFRSTPEWLGLSMYLGMGWIGAVSMVALTRSNGFRFILPLLGGGIAYTVGAVIDGIQLRPLVAGIIRAHEIFHVAVIIGLSLHWWFAWRVAREIGPTTAGAPSTT